ncbi:hypothetical protein Bpfe_014878, partial [Biomphalaria pfeifferi]
ENLSSDIFNTNTTTTYILKNFNSGWLGFNITYQLNTSTITIFQQSHWTPTCRSVSSILLVYLI